MCHDKQGSCMWTDLGSCSHPSLCCATARSKGGGAAKEGGARDLEDARTPFCAAEEGYTTWTCPPHSAHPSLCASQGHRRDSAPATPCPTSAVGATPHLVRVPTHPRPLRQHHPQPPPPCASSPLYPRQARCTRTRYALCLCIRIHPLYCPHLHRAMRMWQGGLGG